MFIQSFDNSFHSGSSTCCRRWAREPQDVKNNQFFPSTRLGNNMKFSVPRSKYKNIPSIVQNVLKNQIRNLICDIIILSIQ